jgi:CHAT domain-containing protein
MQPQQSLRTALITLLAVAATPFAPNFPDLLPTSSTLAQTTDARKAEAGRLYDQAFEQTQTGQFEAALQSWTQALAIYRELGDRVGEARTLTGMGGVYKALGQYSQALELRQQALAIFRAVGDHKGEEATLFKLEAIYRSLGQDSHKQLQQIASAQNATLVEYSIINDFTARGSELQQLELFIWVIEPTGEVAFRRVDLKPLWQQKKSLNDLVDNTLKAFFTQDVRRGTSNKLTFSPGDLVRLNDDEPNWTPWQVVAVNTQNGRLKLKQPSFKEGVTIERSQADVVEKVTSSSTKNQHLQQLHQLLIQPIADLLPTNPSSLVIFIPQGPLFLVPFPALQDATGKYLIEKHTITTAPAIQVLDLTHQQKQSLSGSGKGALVVGNPTGETSQKLPPLPGTEQEAIEIARLHNTKAITGNQATKAAILQQMPQARIIHLAAHGLEGSTGGSVPGAIALAPLGKDNGLLTANEILDLRLSAELVVLSACDTGRGWITSDGIIGLSSSLIIAGVPSVVVSLWSIPDAPTAFLMIEFYRQWQRHRNKATALRQAMLTTMKKHPKPRDWAAFTLIGEAR